MNAWLNTAPFYFYFSGIGLKDEKYLVPVTGFNFSKRVDNKFLTIFILSVVLKKNGMWLKNR